MVDNHDWLGQLAAIDFMRDVGKHFPVPYMLAKDSVASRLETGISYTEFSYMVLQAYDFLVLNKEYGCELQTGGSDQWGNITAGTDLIRRSAGNRAFGLTCPLVTKADGTKFGKTEAGTVWLDAAKTSAYQFYQFWINAEDQKVVDHLKTYTFLEQDAILQLAETVRDQPERREAQRTLATEATTLVHGADAARRAENISHALFYGEFQDLSEEEILEGFDDVPTHAMGQEELGLVDLLVAAGVSPSKRQARQDVQNGSIYINGERCTDMARSMRCQEGLHGKYLIVRRGKKQYTSSASYSGRKSVRNRSKSRAKSRWMCTALPAKSATLSGSKSAVYAWRNRWRNRRNSSKVQKLSLRTEAPGGCLGFLAASA